MKLKDYFKILLTFGALLILGCAAPYRLIEPQTLVYPETMGTTINQEIEITYRYKVLEAKDNKRYERIAKRNGISLLAMRIANYSQDTIYFPEDILIKTESANFHPLEMDEAIDRMLQFNELPSYYIESDDPWLFLGVVSTDVIIMSVQNKANKRFIKEMEEYYLVYSSIPPGEVVSGLIALPVRQNTRLFFEKRD